MNLELSGERRVQPLIKKIISHTKIQVYHIVQPIFINFSVERSFNELDNSNDVINRKSFIYHHFQYIM